MTPLALDISGKLLLKQSSVLLAVALLAVPLMAAFPSAALKPASCHAGDVFANEQVRLWFHGKKGFVKVFPTNASEEEGHYAYHSGELVEVDASGARLARMNLQRAYPQTSGCTLEDTPEWANMTLTVTDDVKGHGGVLGQATVQFAYHFNKSSNGAKFDLNVFDWPWQGSGGELRYAFGVQAEGGSLTPAENGIGYSDPNGVPSGSIEWAPNATVNYPGGATNEADVESNVTMDDAQHAQVVLRFANVTAGYDELLYDPWVGSGLWVVIGPRLMQVTDVRAAIVAAVGQLL